MKKYAVEVRKGDGWVAVGHPQASRSKAFEKLERVRDSGLYDHVRVVVLESEEDEENSRAAAK